MNFSQRVGLQPATKSLQKDSMDTDLRNRLWNALDLIVLPPLKRQWENSSQSSRVGPSATLLVTLWGQFFKFPLSSLSGHAPEALDWVMQWFLNEQQAPWWKIYDFVEFVGNLGGKLEIEAGVFVEICNGVLEQEFSAYRFVGTNLVPITNQTEITAIEQAASKDNSLFGPVSKHIEQALRLLSDRTNPDYRNSIKESISAVEAICRIIGGSGATLGQALKPLKEKVGLHPALEKGFSSLYGWTNDEGGIRHCLMDDSLSCNAEDAKFMLVSCSGFVNYLTEKARKNGLLPH